MSKTASAYGRLRRAKFAYKPVSGDLKSGMPALQDVSAFKLYDGFHVTHLVDIPAPVMTTILLALPSFMS